MCNTFIEGKHLGIEEGLAIRRPIMMLPESGLCRRKEGVLDMLNVIQESLRHLRYRFLGQSGLSQK